MSGNGIFERSGTEALRSRWVRIFASLCWCITQGVAIGTLVHAQQVTAKAPSFSDTVPVDAASQKVPSQALDELPQAPSAERFPVAVPVPDAGATSVTFDADRQSRMGGNRVLLEGNVVIHYGAYRVEADRIAYNEDTGDVEATGHLHVTGSKNTEEIHASRATLNVKTETGRFYDVSGSVGMRQTARGNVYTNGNPFLFTGRMVVNDGPAHYEIYDGTVTSCQLPTPDWQLVAGKFIVMDGKARAYNTMFRLMKVPVFYLPYATHPTEEGERQSGLLIPVIGQSSTKGLVLGEQIYFAMSRWSDLTVGAQYYSKRGWEQSATFRMRGHGLDFLNAHYSGLLDRGLRQTSTSSTGEVTTTVTNQGGEDVTFAGRKDFGAYSRAAANVEYLSSYIYREAFTESFNQAVSSDIVSYAYGTHAQNGYVGSVEVDRYQGLKIVSTGEQIRIFHAPVLQGEVLERHLANTPFVWSATTQFAALKRTQGTPLAQTGFASDFTGRLDVHPKLALPFSVGGFHFRPSVGLRDTYYSKSRTPSPLPGPAPTELDANLNRLLTEAEFELRMPVLERTFNTGIFRRFLGSEAKHTIEPELHYRYATGVDNFNSTLRFDDTDVVSNKNELEYGFTQRLFLRPTKKRECETGETPAETDGACGGARETIRWKLVQRNYFDSNFGGTIVSGRRNVLDTTLDLSGVAFLTDPRSISPIVSEMKLSATDHIDLEWDMNYDTHSGKFTQSNTFLDFHSGVVFGGVSHARLNAPGRFSTGTGSGLSTITSTTSDFSQLRFLIGYGTPTKPGLNVAANMGLDLSAVQPQSTATHIVRAVQTQYASAQFSYNWNCCGFTAEYRKYELGSVRNENAYRFSFTLANIGTAGNLRRAERLF